MLTPAQLATLKADIAADPVLSTLPHTPDDALAIAAIYNTIVSPEFIVWRTEVTEDEFTDLTSAEGTSWNWSAFIARSQGERDGWARMFTRGFINPARPNVRQAIIDIFSGTQNSAPAQRAHCAAIGKRPATRAEQLFSTGTGSVAAPATMTIDAPLTHYDVIRAWEL